MKPNQRIILWCVAGTVGVAGTVVILGVLLWFNRYSFSEMKIGNSTFPVRTSRFTGESQVFVTGEWTQMGVTSSSSSPAKSFAVMPDELHKVQGRAGIRYVEVDGLPQHLLNCSVYNGTSHSLTELIIKLEVKESEKQKGFTRHYKLQSKNATAVLPLSNGDFEVNTGLELEEGRWSWEIVGANRVR